MAANSEMTPQFVRLLDFRQDTEDVFTLTLETKNFSYKPGQFNMLYAFGAGEAAISISGHQENRVIHTIRKVGSVTGLLSKLKVGEEIGVRGPFGQAWPLPEGRDIVIVAGGIGLAPLRPAIRQIVENRDSYGNVHLIYGARSPEDLLFTDEIENWAKLINVITTVDTCDRSWTGHVGVVIPLLEQLELNPKNTIALTCGPEIMMRFTASTLTNKLLEAAQIFISMERNMKCAVSHCGHCQLGPYFVCKDGPVFTLEQLKQFWTVRQM